MERMGIDYIGNGTEFINKTKKRMSRTDERPNWTTEAKRKMESERILFESRASGSSAISVYGEDKLNDIHQVDDDNGRNWCDHLFWPTRRAKHGRVMKSKWEHSILSPISLSSLLPTSDSIITKNVDSNSIPIQMNIKPKIEGERKKHPISDWNWRIWSFVRQRAMRDAIECKLLALMENEWANFDCRYCCWISIRSNGIVAVGNELKQNICEMKMAQREREREFTLINGTTNVAASSVCCELFCPARAIIMIFKESNSFL